MVRGKTMLPSSRYCFHCHKDARYSFLPIDEASTTSVESEMGGFYEGYQKIVVKKIKDRFVDSYSDSIGTLECETSIDLTEKEFKKFIRNISYIKEWNENDDDLDICDETTWSIIIKAINSLGLPELR